MNFLSTKRKNLLLFLLFNVPVELVICETDLNNFLESSFYFMKFVNILVMARKKKISISAHPPYPMPFNKPSQITV